MVVWTLLYSPVVSVKMPRWFVSCLWANWACWALKLIMNATAARFGKSGFINKEGTRPAVVIPTNEELVIAQDASRLTA